MPRRSGSKHYKASRRVGYESQHGFNMVPTVGVNRSAFNRSHSYTTTMNAGTLCPIYVDECLPGDTHTISAVTLARMPTLLHAPFEQLYLDLQWFFVPDRLVWDNAARFYGERRNPDDHISYTIPTVDVPGTPSETHTNFDYAGVPLNNQSVTVNSLPFRAMALIWNEWYRSPRISDAIDVPTDDGPDDQAVLRGPFRRMKRHDYFTAALPSPAVGEPVQLPIGEYAPVIPDPNQRYPEFQAAGDLGPVGQLSHGSSQGLGTTPAVNNGLVDWESSGLIADLESAVSATINAQRMAFQTQRLLERDSRGGTRYQELIWHHFQVRSDDARLNRPEFIRGSTARIMINPVAATASLGQAENERVGDLGAIGESIMMHPPARYSATEHGWIICFASIRGDLKYQQGLDRMWTRRTRYDVYWPVFQRLGEQAILNQEIFYQNNPSPDPDLPLPDADDGTWGYQERWAEYRFKHSRVTGQMRSTNPIALDTWHLAYDFAALPNLNEEFLQEEPPIDRIIAVGGGSPSFKTDVFFNVRSVRPIPVFSQPGMLDHF